MSTKKTGSARSKPISYIKTKRAFNSLRKYAWLITVGIALGGLWEPKLGLLVIGIMAGLMRLGREIKLHRHHFLKLKESFERTLHPVRFFSVWKENTSGHVHFDPR